MKVKRDSLDELFSEFIRKRAIKRVGGCERCLTSKYDKQKEDGKIFPAWRQLQCSHYHKRRKQSTRFDEDNCNGFCFGCHQYFEENRDEYTEWMIAQLGEDKFNMLQARMRNTWPKPDRELIGIYLKEKIKEVDDE